MTHPSVLTRPQRMQLHIAYLSIDGCVSWGKAKGFAMNRWQEMMERLCQRGLFRPYPHGGYEITEAGRKVYEKGAKP